MIKKSSIQFNDEVFYCLYVQGNKDAKKVLKIFEGSTADVFGFDTETTFAEGYKDHPKAGLEPHITRIRLLQLYDPVKRVAAVFDLFHIDIELFVGLFSTRLFVAHYALFDISQMRHKGVEVPRCDCTLIMANLLHHARIGTDFRGLGSLDKCIDREFKYYVPKEMQRSDWSKEILTPKQIQYAALDVYLVHKLREKYAAKIKKMRMWKIYKLYRGVQQPVVSMMLNGIRMHTRKHIDLIYKWEAERYNLQQELDKIFHNVNLRSPKQLTEWIDTNLPEEKTSIWPRTESGKFYATDYETLVEFKDLEFIDSLVEFKRLDKLCTTYGRKLHDKINPVTKRVHGSYTIGQTQTGRMSGDLQQFPRDNKEHELYFRRLFVPAKGNTIVCADYSQIELRLAGEISGDPVIRRAYEKGIDLHSLMGLLMAGKKSIEEVTKQERQDAKPCNFGQLYGSGAAGLQRQAKNSYGVIWELHEADRYVKIFRDLYKVLRKWQVSTTKLAEKTLITTTPLGKIKKLQKGKTYTVSLNVPIQGGAAEVMQIALIYFDREIRAVVKETGWDIRLINCVHDEVVVECEDREEVITKTKEVLEDCMTRAYAKVFPKATLNGIVDAHHGKSWAEAKP